MTEDSDAFLFGSRVVYKNIFEDRRFVEVYRAEDVERELGLGRHEVARIGDLEVPDLARHHHDATAHRLDQRRVVGGLAAAAMGAADRLSPKGLRRLDSDKR